MNKFAAIVLFAFVAVAAAEYEDSADTVSQAMSFIPTDDEEVAYLPENQKVFESFCRDSRDFVNSEIRYTSNLMASSVFSTFWQSAEALGQESISTIDSAKNRLGKQLQKPNSAIEPAQTAADELLKEAQEKIANGESQPVAFLTAFKGTVAAVSKSVGNFLGNKLEAIKSKANPAQLWSTILEVCEKAGKLEKELISQFAQNAQSLNPAVEYEDLMCVTTRRVARVDGICNFTKAAKPTLPKFWGKKL